MDPESQPEQPRATEATPLLPRPEPDLGSSSTTPRPIPRRVIILHWVSAVGGALVAALGIAILVVNEYFRPVLYDFPWGVKGGVIPTILTGLVSTAWATSSLVHVRRKGVFMPPLVSAIMHAGLAGYFVVLSWEGVGGLEGGGWRPCDSWAPVDPIKEHECRDWAAKFTILLRVYLALGLFVGLVHVALFVLTCRELYRVVSWRYSWTTWRFPAGQLSVEFNVKFLRQDENMPGPVEARNDGSATGEL